MLPRAYSVWPQGQLHGGSPGSRDVCVCSVEGVFKESRNLRFANSVVNI